MIIDAIIGFFMSIPSQLINAIDVTIDLAIPSGAFDWWNNIFTTLTYVFPVWAVLPILVTSIGIKLLQAPYSIILRVKSFFWAS